MSQKLSTKNSLKIAFTKTRSKLSQNARRIFTRGSVANLLMFSFILLSALGAGMIYVPAGLITAGVCCGLFGYLLGSE
jgi:hypothetical protein